MEQNFTAHVPLLSTISAFGLGRGIKFSSVVLPAVLHHIRTTKTETKGNETWHLPHEGQRLDHKTRGEFKALHC